MFVNIVTLVHTTRKTFQLVFYPVNTTQGHLLLAIAIPTVFVSYTPQIYYKNRYSLLVTKTVNIVRDGKRFF